MSEKNSREIKYRIRWLVASIIMIFSLLFIFVSAEEGHEALVKLDNPFNNSIDLDSNITFSFIISNSSFQMNNCSLIFQDNINQTNTNITNETQYFYINNLPNGNYNWSVGCYQTNGNFSSSETREFEVFIDSTPPEVTLDIPVHNSVESSRNLQFNYSVTDDGWVTKCNLYTDMNGTWAINKSNIFVQKNTTLSFEVDNVPDDTTFKWNVLCYDFASTANSDWGDANYTVTVDNNRPIHTSIPNQNWDEDSPITLNLTNYFSDPDGDELNFNSSSVSNLSVLIDNQTGIATIVPDSNWYGNQTMIFYAIDIYGQTNTSNSVTLTVNQVGDTAPNYILTTPINNLNDTDGVVTIECNATDDMGLSNISLYINTTGIWQNYQTNQVSGRINSTSFVVSNLNEGSYLWACKFEDNNSQSKWSSNYTFNVDILPEIIHDFSNFTVNHIDHNRTVIVSYSGYLNNSLVLKNLTIYLSNGSVYFNRDLTSVNEFYINETEPPLLVYPEKLRVRYNEIFYGNFTVGNTQWINITLQYSYNNITSHISTKHIINIISV